MVFRDRYLLGIAGQMLLFTLGSTLLYFQVAHLVAGSGLDSASRTRLFARVDLAVNVAALLTGSLTAANQNEWIRCIKEQLLAKHTGLHLVDIRPSDDDRKLVIKAVREMIQMTLLLYDGILKRMNAVKS
jgi:hypothetical protein